MKKTIAVLLVVLMTVGLVACGASGGAANNASGANATTAAKVPNALAEGQILVGYGKADITPELSVPLSGYGNTERRMSTGFMDYLYATCFAVTDAEGNTAILFGIDMGNSSGELYVRIRESIAQKYQIPVENIIISASHTHSAPDMGSSVPSIAKWRTTLIKRIEEAADMAMEDRAPADIYMATTETQGLNFVRRYALEDGTVNGYQSIITASGLKIVGHETEADHSLQLLKFDRGEGKKDIMVANFQTHPHRAGSATNPLMTADLVGAFRTEIEQKLGYDVVYFTGAAGNINPTSMIEEENITKDHKEQGQALAKYAIDAESTYEKISGGKVQAVCEVYESQIDHTEDHLIDVAREAQKMWTETNDIMAVTNAYKPYGINGPYHANAIVSKYSKGPSDSFNIYAVSFGDVGFACAPYEMFDTNGMFIKENSPFAITFVAECANGANGYFPSSIAWDNNGYEVDTCKYMKGAAEEMADRFVAMLQGMYDNK